jgi:hypothetical protein
LLFLLQLGSVLNTRRNRAQLLCALLLASSFLFACPGARAQLNANIANVNLTATLSTSLTVSATPGLVNFALVPNGTANGSSTITITTAWTLQPSVGAVTCYAYFIAPGTALSDGAGDNIPSANVSGSADAGAFAAFTANSPFAAGSSLQIFRERIIGTNKTKTRSDTLNLQISTAGLALPAGTYTGVLRIQAQAL